MAKTKTKTTAKPKKVPVLNLPDKVNFNERMKWESRTADTRLFSQLLGNTLRQSKEGVGQTLTGAIIDRELSSPVDRPDLDDTAVAAIQRQLRSGLARARAALPPEMVGERLDGIRFIHGTIRNLNVVDCKFLNSNLWEVLWRNVLLYRNTFANTVANQWSLFESRVRYTYFLSCDLSRLNAKECEISGTSFEHSDLSNCSFYSTTVANNCINRCNLTGLYLAGSDWQENDLEGSFFLLENGKARDDGDGVGDPTAPLQYFIVAGNRTAVTVGPLGSRNDRLVAFAVDRRAPTQPGQPPASGEETKVKTKPKARTHSHSGIVVNVGCFQGTLEAFRRKVDKKYPRTSVEPAHQKHRRDYLDAIAYLEQWRKGSPDTYDGERVDPKNVGAKKGE